MQWIFAHHDLWCRHCGATMPHDLRQDAIREYRSKCSCCSSHAELLALAFIAEQRRSLPEALAGWVKWLALLLTSAVLVWIPQSLLLLLGSTLG